MSSASVFFVTICYPIKFILLYEGANPAILRLQMRLMCWDVDIVHRPDTELVDADYWSRLGVDLNFDPLYHKYLHLLITYGSQSQPPRIYQCAQKICLTFAVHAFRRLLLKFSLRTHCIFRVSFLISSCWMVEDIPFCQIIQ